MIEKRRTRRAVLLAPITNLGTTSGHLRERKFCQFPCKRRQTKHLVFYPACFASRGPRVRVPPRPPIFSIICAISAEHLLPQQVFLPLLVSLLRPRQVYSAAHVCICAIKDSKEFAKQSHEIDRLIEWIRA